jgi:hypothetical protein
VKWTADKPTRRGWYWAWDDSSGHAPEIIVVNADEESDDWERYGTTGEGQSVPLQTWEQFAGPLEWPEEAEWPASQVARCEKHQAYYGSSEGCHWCKHGGSPSWATT